MFEIFGSFKESAEPETYVHTRPLSDGEQPSEVTYWRDDVNKNGYSNYRQTLLQQIAECRAARIAQILQKQPQCELLDGTGKRILEPSD